MSYLSLYVFDGGNWTKPGPFTNLRFAVSQGSHPRWSGNTNTLSIYREDNETLVDLTGPLNTSDFHQVLTNEFATVSHRLPALVNAYFRPPVRISYASGNAIQGPGGATGGLPFVPDYVKGQMLLTFHVDCHLNTPAGMASVDGVITYYFYVHLDNTQVKADFLGTEHSWHFNTDGYGAYQDEINLGLEGGANDTITNFSTALATQIQLPIPFRDLYLLPGSGAQPQEGAPLRDDASVNTVIALIV